MDSVDNTILGILAGIGCTFEHKSVATFQSEDVYRACAAVMMRVDSDKKVPRELPVAKATRFRLCQDMARDISGMGYPNKLSYDAFLYPNAVDTRKLLMWVIDKLPKAAEEEDTVQADGGIDALITNNLRAWSAAKRTALNRITVSRQRALATVPLSLPSAASPEYSKYVGRYQPQIYAQISSGTQLAPSLFERNSIEVIVAAEKEKDWNQEGGQRAAQALKVETRNSLLADAFRGATRKRGLSGSDLLTGGSTVGYTDKSTFSRRKDFGQDHTPATAQVMTDSGATATVGADGAPPPPEQSEEEVRQQREKELGALNDRLRALVEMGRAYDSKAEQTTSSSRQIEGDITAQATETKKLEDIYRVRARTLNLLGPKAAENLAELKKLTAASSDRLLQLGRDWETFRAPLVAKYRRQKQLLAERKEEVVHKVEMIKRMRKEMKDKIQDIRTKDALHKQVADELNKLPKSINRQVYVNRIMDIVRNLERQKVDIAKVLVDVRRVQKEINSTSESSKRSFTLADEIIFQVAKTKKDPTAIEAYKHVVAMRDGFIHLVQATEDIGKAKNDTREAESRIDQIESRNTNLNMERVEKDLDAVKKENKALAQRAKALSGGGSTAGDE